MCLALVHSSIETSLESDIYCSPALSSNCCLRGEVSPTPRFFPQTIFVYDRLSTISLINGSSAILLHLNSHLALYALNLYSIPSATYLSLAAMMIGFVACSSRDGYLDVRSAISCHLQTLIRIAILSAASASHPQLSGKSVVLFSSVARTFVQDGTRW